MIVQTRTTEESLYWGSLQTSQGLCTVFATDKGICWMGTPGTEREYGLNWLGKRMKIGQMYEDGQAVESLAQALEELDRYFAGEHVQFSCQLDLRGTAFQIAVWQELYRIPYGQIRSYAQIAQAIGRPAAVRAVGAANGANPIAVIVPCHRVIGSNGALTGYAGGLPMKQWLLALEDAPLVR